MVAIPEVQIYRRAEEMREKIIWLMKGRDLTKDAKAILALITEEIKKVENPYQITTRYDDPRYMDRLAHECFEEARQKIIKALEEK
jgi:hypothetical protein